MAPSIGALRQPSHARCNVRIMQIFERRAEEESATHGCPALAGEQPKVNATASKSRGAKGEAGPKGCTCTSLYEHRLLEPFPCRKRARE